jgi:hypothetical protein
MSNKMPEKSIPKVSWGVANMKKNVTPNVINTSKPICPTLKTGIFEDNFSTLFEHINTIKCEEEPPEKIFGSYKDDYNILNIDNIIYQKFNYQRDKRIKDLSSQINEENEKIKLPQTYIDRKISRENIEKMKKQLHELVSQEDILHYKQESEPYIEAYKNFGIKPKVVMFGRTKNTTNITPTTKPEEINIDDPLKMKQRHQIIRNYLKVAKKYINIDVSQILPITNRCLICGFLFKPEIFHEDDENEILLCLGCGAEKSDLHNSIMFEMSTPSLSKRGYEDKGNYYKAFLRFQGKEQNKIPEILFDRIDEYFESYGLPTREKAKLLEYYPVDSPLSFKIKRDTSRDLMITALSKTGYVDYYDNVNLICSICWDWVLPDLSPYEDLVMFIYDETQIIFETDRDTRKSNINVQYRLFKTFQLLSLPYKITDFKMIKTKDIISDYDKSWRIMVEGAHKNNKNKKLPFTFKFISSS